MAAVPVSQPNLYDGDVTLKPGQRELERLEIQHLMVRESMGSLVLAPIDFSKPGLRILDQATGGGAWLRDVRSTSTAAHTYLGTDIVDEYFPSDPGPGMTFHHQSMTEEWPSDWVGSFDLVHSRFALAGAGGHSLQGVVKDLVALLKPGGYIQLVEVEMDVSPVGPATGTLRAVISSVFESVTARQLGSLRKDATEWLSEAGVEGIQARVITNQLGLSAKTERMRELSVVSMVNTARSISKMTRTMPVKWVSREELDSLPAVLEKELREQGGCSKLFALWGRKPTQ